MPLPNMPTLGLQGGFFLIALILGVWWVYAVRRAYASHTGVRRNNSKTLITFGVFVLWSGLLYGVSQQEWAHQFDTFPPPGLRVFLALIVATVVIAFSTIGRTLANGVPMILLVGFQVFRLPVELLIHQAATAGIAPIEMTYEGRNFDITTAVLALVLVVALHRGVASTRVLMGWNVLGLLLLLNVVVTAIMAMPHPFQLLHTNPPNVWVTYFPYILLPGVMVCSALLGHLLVFRALAMQPRG